MSAYVFLEVAGSLEALGAEVLGTLVGLLPRVCSDMSFPTVVG